LLEQFKASVLIINKHSGNQPPVAIDRVRPEFDEGESDPDLLLGDERTFIVSPSLWIGRLGAASCSARRPYVARLRM
jgi:hypothetical protein